MLIKYPTKYTAVHGTINTHIENHFDEQDSLCLLMEIKGLKFKASSFDNFELQEYEKYTVEQLRQFTLNKVPIHNSDNFAYELCNCRIQFEIPIFLIDFQENKEIKAILDVDLVLGEPASNGGIDYEQATFTISVNEKKYTVTCDVFETGFEELKRQFNKLYHFKNCFGCQYSDYSPYGNGFFGDILCFRENKLEYLKADSKTDFLSLANKGFIQVQETYCCNQFEIRKPNTGYRG